MFEHNVSFIVMDLNDFTELETTKNVRKELYVFLFTSTKGLLCHVVWVIDKTFYDVNFKDQQIQQVVCRFFFIS